MGVGREEREREAAEAYDAALGLSAEAEAYAAHRVDGPTPKAWPTLHLDDVSGIPFLEDIAGVERYQLRAAVRATDGDLVASTCPPMPEYDRYNRDRLGFGAPTTVTAPPVGPAIEVARACLEGEAFEAIVGTARAGGGLLVHPYMGIEAVWTLAARVAEASGVEVRVLAPPPPVTWFANDKHHLTSVARDVVGVSSVVATRSADSAPALAAALRELARDHARVALKMTRCASAMGNRIFEAGDIASWDDAALVAQVEAFLRDKQWALADPVLVVSWETTTSSPSSQLWIPPLGSGPPRLDGLYEQLLHGPEQMFLGSIPSSLPAEVERQMTEASMAVARVYQRLGYVGRCSFDFIVVGDEDVRFVECNGRWGGTSTPMHLMDRLFPGGRPAYRARDYVSEALVGVSFQELADRLGDTLYDARTGSGTYVLYNTGCLEPYGKFDVIAFGRDMDEANAALEVRLPELVEP